MIYRHYGFVLFFTFFLAGCPYDRPPKRVTSGAKPITLNYPYEMPDSERSKFFKGLEELRPDQPIKDVVQKLGPPFSEDAISGKGKNAPVTGTLVVYYLKARDSSVNESY